MKAKTGDPKLDQALGKLARALRGLDGTEGRPIARRNARRRVLTAARALRGQVDERWPAIVQRAGVQRLTPETRRRRLLAAGWVERPSPDVAAFATAGVPIRCVKETVTTTNAMGQPVKRQTARYYVPSWADAIGTGNPARLRAAKRSTNEQKIARAEANLKN